MNKWLRWAVSGAVWCGVVLALGCGSGSTPPADRSLYLLSSSGSTCLLRKVDYDGKARGSYPLSVSPGPGVLGLVADHTENVYLLLRGVAGRQVMATPLLVKIDPTGHQVYAVVPPLTGDSRVERLGVGATGLFLISSHGTTTGRAVASAGATLRTLSFAGTQTAAFALPANTVDEGYAAVLQDTQKALYVVVSGQQTKLPRLLKYTPTGTLLYDKTLRAGLPAVAAAMGPDMVSLVTSQAAGEFLERYKLDGSFYSRTTLVGDATLSQTRGLAQDSTGRIFRVTSGQGEPPNLYEESVSGFRLLTSPPGDTNTTVWGLAASPGP